MDVLTLKPSLALKRAVSSLRTVGTVFIMIGGLFSLIPLAGKTNPMQTMQMAASGSICLLAPGIIYHLSAAFMKRHDLKMALLAQRTAILQSIVCIADLGCLVVIPSRSVPPFVYGAVPILFFIPALLVQAYEIQKALHELRTMPQAQRGFDVLSVLPVSQQEV